MTIDNTKIGTVGWMDLTVKDADKIKDFYCEVVGWKAKSHNMGDYNDFTILPPEHEDPITGICHARDSNVNLPAQWLIYIHVADVQESVQKCLALGGKVIDGPRMMGESHFCVIQDPAGAILALIS